MSLSLLVGKVLLVNEFTLMTLVRCCGSECLIGTNATVNFKIIVFGAATMKPLSDW